MINVTPAAVERIKELINEAGDSDKSLRIFIDSGGCSGLQYNMIVEKKAEGDHVVECGDIKIFIDDKSSQYLRGCSVDFVDTLTSTGFRINNPNAKQTCGCGTSFEAQAG